MSRTPVKVDEPEFVIKRHFHNDKPDTLRKQVAPPSSARRTTGSDDWRHTDHVTSSSDRRRLRHQQATDYPPVNHSQQSSLSIGDIINMDRDGPTMGVDYGIGTGAGQDEDSVSLLSS